MFVPIDAEASDERMQSGTLHIERFSRFRDIEAVLLQVIQKVFSFGFFEELLGGHLFAQTTSD